ncbi:MAG: hypothetical protein EPN82_08710 [Bacteroidetes bacterium]|nr:MAG: hypothetical protein EPN82_08710 [Bacteroidota bacterium]
MKTIWKKLIFTVFILLVIFYNSELVDAKTKVSQKDKNKTDVIQRTSFGAFDLQKNTVSNIEFFSTNYGIFGLDILNNVGGGKWPRGSLNQYIFGGGIWFATQKRYLSTDTNLRKLVEISYNPNSGAGWMVPGRIEDNQPKVDMNETKKYRAYFSTDFKKGDGTPQNPNDGPNWPIWDSSPNPEDTLKKDRYFGNFIYEPDPDNNQVRNTTNYPKGPAFISGEDIFSTYKDTDLSYFDGGDNLRRPMGYPLNLQFEQMIYSWGFGDYRDFIFIKYQIFNFSKDTLWNCWVAPVMDIDIGRLPNPVANNDRVKYYSSDPSLNLAIQWTDAQPASGEKGYGFGYLGFDFLESPAVDVNGFLRKDKKVYENSEQLGLITFKNWNIEEDINEDDSRYNTMASGVRDGDNGIGDKRFMMSTGPFTMLPGDSVRIVVGMILAGPAAKKDADGTDEDAAELIRKDKFAQSVYDNNFRAPTPPELPRFTGYKALNNAIHIEWKDITSENSYDPIENGLGFMGYRLYRARRPELDTFNTDQIQPSNANKNKGQGPLGWKQIAQWEMPTPFYKSVYRTGNDQNNTMMPFIDSMRIVGPNIINGEVDKTTIKVMRIGKGMMLAYPESWVKSFLSPITGGYNIPVIMGIDTATQAQPWGTFYAAHSQPGDFPLYHNPFNPQIKKHYLLDDVTIGIVNLITASVPYNPLLSKKETIIIQDTVNLPSIDEDTVYLKNTLRVIKVNNTTEFVIDRMIPYDMNLAMKDTIHLKNTLDSVYSYIQKRYATVKFPNFESTAPARNEAIIPYMAKITNDRTYIDIGDDNHDGVIDFADEPNKTEKLINNIDYWYKLRAYDEGDYSQSTPVKLVEGDVDNSNVMKVYPLAEAAMKPVKFDVTVVDSSKMGGLYNFRMFALDPDRVSQIYGGHEFELEFVPSWDFRTVYLLNNKRAPTDPIPTKDLGWYQRELILKDLTANKTIFDGKTWFEPTPCQFSRNNLTEDAASVVSTDQVIDTVNERGDKIIITFGIPADTGKVIQTSHFTTGEFKQQGYCYNRYFNSEALGTFGFEFDFAMMQMGGRYRPDPSSKIISSDATTPVTFITDIENPIHEPDKVLTTQPVDFQPQFHQFAGYPSGTYNFVPYGQFVYSSFNNGPADYIVEFQPGGLETMQLTSNNITKTYDVPYLTVKVTNKASFMRPGADKEVEVNYPGELEHINLDIDTLTSPPKMYAYPPSLKDKASEYLNKFNLSAYGYINARYVKFLQLKKCVAIRNTEPYSGKATFVGEQGRYYLTGLSQDKQDTVDFCNILSASGVYFAFDYARQGGRLATVNEWQIDPNNKKNFGADFKEGDKVELKTQGGVLGLPLPGAKVKFKVDTLVPKLESYTDDLLNQINIVPNPYYITHEGQKSPYDAKLYFTKLPKKCTIDIYTATADLIVSINHDEYISPEPDKEGIEVWDLLSKNGQRVQSQTLVALITTPNGAQTIKKFAVVVGGFRIVPENN